MTTPAFPKNGPGIDVKFDDVTLLLMGHDTPPDVLLKHMDELGREFSEEILGTRTLKKETTEFLWVEGKSPELDAVLS
eukprot:2982685-Rhodomonas_salina.1